MIAAVKAEFRKLLSVRSTYVIIGFAVAMALLFAFYGHGLRFTGNVKDPFYLRTEVIEALNALGLFISLIGVLLMTHEYRYNTIMYTLTASNSRSKTLLAKLIAVSVYSIVLTLFIGAFSPLVTAIGLQIKDVHLVHQVFYFKDLIWRAAFFGWGYAMFALMLAVLIRNQIGVIVTLFLVPGPVEGLLGFVLLKQNSVYLPFSALNQVLGTTGDTPPNAGHLEPGKAAMVAGAYLLVGWIVAWILFLKRDAN